MAWPPDLTALRLTPICALDGRWQRPWRIADLGGRKAVDGGLVTEATKAAPTSPCRC